VKLIIASPFVLLFCSATFGQSLLYSKVGIVNSLPDAGACLAIRNTRLKKGDRIQALLPDKPQAVLVATIAGRTPTSCSSDNDVFENATFYRLKMPKREDPFVGFGIIQTTPVQIVRGVAKADLDRDRKDEYFRSCTSMEGLHLTIWKGKPLTGKRIWHTYYYLGYDTEPSCKKNEYEGLD
jgi:hypothetical protein